MYLTGPMLVGKGEREREMTTYYPFCSVVLFVDEADAFLRKRSKVH